MISVQKIKKILQKGLCINEQEETPSLEHNQREEMYIESNDDDEWETAVETYPTVPFDIRPSEIDNEFDHAFTHYTERLESDNGAASKDDPWLQYTSILNAYHYQYPAEENLYGKAA